MQNWVLLILILNAGKRANRALVEPNYAY